MNKSTGACNKSTSERYRAYLKIVFLPPGEGGWRRRERGGRGGGGVAGIAFWRKKFGTASRLRKFECTTADKTVRLPAGKVLGARGNVYLYGNRKIVRIDSVRVNKEKIYDPI
ncbi:hypothetical protein GWI33_017094 [Rhynchophorus ferrugineus]|uniref:Uncharacterized protein n=1 Tax=Rhynchophorus ferrugineus TaxID=354439 RepID=A0A834HXD5_RHYFE|nr:hypothetical protein GWI33_017094 [Rhynchophorus ferrugineus]